MSGTQQCNIREELAQGSRRTLRAYECVRFAFRILHRLFVPDRRQVEHVARETPKDSLSLFSREKLNPLMQAVKQILLVNLAEDKSVQREPSLQAFVFDSVATGGKESYVALNAHTMLRIAAFVDPVGGKA